MWARINIDQIIITNSLECERETIYKYDEDEVETGVIKCTSYTKDYMPS